MLVPSMEATAGRLYATCTTAATDAQGWKECKSLWKGIKAEKGYYFDRHTLKKIRADITGGGSCSSKLSRWIEIDTGREKPTKISIRASAQSPPFQIGKTGTTVCEYTVEAVSYK
jgi:hypothetical protein